MTVTQPLPTALDQLLIKPVAVGGVPVPARPYTNFVSGVTSTDNPNFIVDGVRVGSTDLVVSGGGGGSGGQQTTTVANGLNSNVVTGGLATLRLVGPTAAFEIGGFSPASAWAAGQTLVVVNTTVYPMTIVPADALSASANRIDTQSGLSITLPPRKSSASFVYDGTTSLWVLQNIGLITPVFINARDFATGNGSTDDTAALQAAITAATGGRCHIPSGTYVVTSDLLIPSNTNITGDGDTTVIAATVAVNRTFYFNAVSNSSLRNVQIQGGSYSIAIENGSSYVTVDSCHVVNTVAYGITVADNFTSGGAGGHRITNCLVDMTGCRTISNLPIGIEIFPKGGPGFLATPGIIIEGNTILGAATYMLDGIKVSAQQGGRIANNWVSNISGNYMGNASEGGINVGTSIGMVVIGNYVVGCDIGIDCTGENGIDNGISNTDCVIEGNTIVSCNYYNIYSSAGSSGLTIQGNSLSLGSVSLATGIDLDHTLINVTGTTSGAGGAVQLTAVGHRVTSGQWVYVTGVGGTIEANGYWPVTAVDANTLLLLHSSYVNGFTSGGTVEAMYANLLVVNNNCQGLSIGMVGYAYNGKFSGNRLSGGAVTGGQITVQGPGCLLSDNYCTQVQGTALQVVGNDCMICNNYVNFSSASGIIVNGNNSFIHNNRVRNCNNLETVNGSCVYLAPGSQNFLISTNIFQNEDITSADYGLAYYGIYYGSNSGLVTRDNQYIGMLTSDVFSNTPTGSNTLNGQAVHGDHTTTSAGANTSEDVLKSYTLDVAPFGINGGVRIKAAGNSSGSGGSKTVRAYFTGSPFVTGSEFATLTLDAEIAYNWMIDATVFNVGNEENQVWEYRSYVNGSLVTEDNGTLSISTATTAPIITVTGQKISGSDAVSCCEFLVENFR